jgi:3-methyladenine DNA glycosylase Mpg
MTRAQLDGVRMPRSSALVLSDAPVPASDVVVTPRIGITKAVDHPLRFHIRDSPWISGRLPSRQQKGRP